tara:strand:+ start:115 stop:279 length:165 start_codon:yes stop_codon:yes gene_type:complete
MNIENFLGVAVGGVIGWFVGSLVFNLVASKYGEDIALIALGAPTLLLLGYLLVK